mmetsp:Transcript_22492/g.35397  ORF Transcript_22492/g.35397 Transcript_22492/m.35397 type:complete len:231 (-) Transcript_22492:161-853(-)
MPHAHFVRPNIGSAAVTTVGCAMLIIIVILAAKALSLPLSGIIRHTLLGARCLTFISAMPQSVYLMGKRPIVIPIIVTPKIRSDRLAVFITPRSQRPALPNTHLVRPHPIAAAVAILLFAVLHVIPFVAAETLTLMFATEVRVSLVDAFGLALQGAVHVTGDFLFHDAVKVAIFEAAEVGRAGDAVLEVAVRRRGVDDTGKFRFEVATEGTSRCGADDGEEGEGEGFHGG